MSGECDRCGQHTTECCCEARYILKCVCGSGCPCRGKEFYTHLNVVMKREDDSYDYKDVKWINIRGRAEHEAVIRDRKMCEDLGLDQIYETVAYLKRWKGWLSE
jgi:hypothetical protein